MKRYRGLTWIGWLNFLLLRWFFVRVYWIALPDNTVNEDGSEAYAGTFGGWGVQFPIWPLPWSGARRVFGKATGCAKEKPPA